MNSICKSCCQDKFKHSMTWNHHHFFEHILLNRRISTYTTDHYK
nr:MAG TPA: hypothetical protein [Bacteriophage sp.]